MDTYISNEEGEFYKLELGKLEAVTAGEDTELSDFYLQIKPSQTGYTFLSLSLHKIEDLQYQGLLNYRVNGIHKQKRI